MIRFLAGTADANPPIAMSVLVVLLGLLGSTQRVDPAECGTSFRGVQLAEPRAVDGVRVVLRDGSPGKAASRVTVAAGRDERVLTVAQGGHWALRFGPALRTRRLTVSVEPTGTQGACIEKVILLCGSEEVAVVTP
jgi:hypothetical protein